MDFPISSSKAKKRRKRPSGPDTFERHNKYRRKEMYSATKIIQGGNTNNNKDPILHGTMYFLLAKLSIPYLVKAIWLNVLFDCSLTFYESEDNNLKFVLRFRCYGES